MIQVVYLTFGHCGVEPTVHSEKIRVTTTKMPNNEKDLYYLTTSITRKSPMTITSLYLKAKVDNDNISLFNTAHFKPISN